MFVRKVLTLLVFPSPKDGLFLQSQIWFVLKKIFSTKCSSDLISTMNDNSFQNWGAPMHGCLKGHVLLMQYSHNFFYYSSKGVAECCQGYVWDKIDNRCIPTRKIIPKFFKVNLKNNRENMPILQYFSNVCLNSKNNHPSYSALLSTIFNSD